MPGPAHKILIVDNIDSFTWNIAQCVSQVTGAMPVVRRNDEIGWDEIAADGFDRIIISPGPGTPEKEADFGVSREVLHRAEVPVLGVCLGHQGIGLEFGARVIHAPEPLHGRVWRIRHSGDVLFSGIPETFEATRYHSLMVERPLPDSLEEIAWTSDGVVMGLRHRTRPIWGVQFHPESIGTPWGSRLLENFVRLDPERLTIHGPGRAKHAPGSSRPPLEADRDAGDALRLHCRVIAEEPLDDGFFFRAFAAADRFWLDSSAHQTGRGRFSYMGDASGPRSRVLRFARTGNEDDWRRANLFARALARGAQSLRTWPSDLPFDFVGGIVGYLGYEYRGGVEPLAGFPTIHPDAQFILADRFVATDHHAGTSYAVQIATHAERGAVETWMDALEKIAAARAEPRPSLVRSGSPVRFGLRHERQDYLERIARSLSYIRDGESYEICLTNCLHTAARPDPATLYRTLRTTNPAPYAAFLDFPGLSILSSSPECFLKLDQLGNVTAKPIKGTIGRSDDPIKDHALAAQLRTSEKDRAENLMIVDLLRNDLGRVCELGSVHVPELMEIESFATVHQMVTTISGRLAPEHDFIDCLLAAFPGGSMTGAPKTRTLGIIEELEEAPRGIYSGAIGFLSANGAAEMSIVIRTIVIDENGCSIGAGGAIVAASNPAAEYDETILKARALVEAIAQVTAGDRHAYELVAETEAVETPRVSS